MSNNTLTEVDDQALSVIGSLALSIRGDWSSTKGRINLMCDLCSKYNLEYLLPEITDWNGDDGRYFRGWNGPYGECTMADLEALELSTDIFTYPETVITDYKK